MCCRNKADLTEPTVPTNTPKGREGQSLEKTWAKEVESGRNKENNS